MNKIRLFSFALLLGVLLFSTACGSEEVLPATRAEVTIPTPTPLPSPPSPPTIETSEDPTVTPAQTLTPTATPAQTLTPTLASTETADISLTIKQPEDRAEVVAGEEITVSGQIQPVRDEELYLELEVVSRIVAAGTVTVDADTGTWTATLPVGRHVTGPARLLVNLADSEEVATIIELEILPDAAAGNPGLTLKRPGEHDTAVAGYTLFFAGRVRNPINNTITISVLVDNCTTVATSQSFVLTGGVWHGLLILPAHIVGPACAVATTGTEGDGEWRQARMPITVLTSNNEQATSLTLGSPGEDRTFQSGQIAHIFGIAVNAPDNTVHVVVNLDNVDTTVLAEGIARVDAFGYWEVELPLPEDVTGPALITASMGEGNHYVEFRASTTITP